MNGELQPHNRYSTFEDSLVRIQQCFWQWKPELEPDADRALSFYDAVDRTLEELMPDNDTPSAIRFMNDLMQNSESVRVYPNSEQERQTWPEFARDVGSRVMSEVVNSRFPELTAASDRRVDEFNDALEERE